MRLRLNLVALLLTTAALNGCGNDDMNDASFPGRDTPGEPPTGGGNPPVVGDNPLIVEDDPLIVGDEGDQPGTGGVSSSDGCNPDVIGLLRDFSDQHPNFEGHVASEKGIVAETLGADQKPVFAGGEGLTVSNATDFDQWYRDTPGINETFQHQLDFTTDPATGNAVYDNSAFFPLDGRGFGNQGRDHNFHFTFELHMKFRYDGGETFTFTGDDDLFVFINNRLAIDLGGVHGAESQTIDLDAEAARLGITVGNEYAIDFFQAERHTGQSNFRIETSLLFTNCDPIIIPGKIK